MTDKSEIKETLTYLQKFFYDQKVNEDDLDRVIDQISESDGVKNFAKDLLKLRSALNRIGQGELSFQIDGKGSTFGALKSLQATLKHITWQMEAVSGGDFSQSIDFLGEFSFAFQQMRNRLQDSMNELEKARKVEEDIKKYFKTIFHMIPEPIFITTLEDFRILDFNLAFLTNSGYIEQDIDGNADKSPYIYRNDSEKKQLIFDLLKEKGFCENIEVKFLTKDNDLRTGLVSARVYNVEESEMVVHVVRDITLIKEYEKSLKEREKQLALIFENSPIGILNYTLDGKIVNVNQYLCTLLDETRDELLKINIMEVSNKKLVKAVKKSLEGETVILEDLFETLNYRKKVFVRATFAPSLDEGGQVSGGIGIFEDFTERRKMEQEIRKLSVTDKLTQLYNRLKLDEVLDKEIARSQRLGRTFGVILIDIDNFKMINDRYGHQVGDQVLFDLSRLIEENIRRIDVVGRWGGEEFLIISQNTDIDGAFALAEKLRVKIENEKFQNIEKLTCSFGVSVWYQDDGSFEVISRADEALYLAKRNGRNRVEKRI